MGNKILSYLKSRDFKINIVLILSLLMIRATVFGNYTVPTGSMNPTIIEGDKFFSNKLAYSLKLPLTKIDIARWDTPSPGDIIAFKYPLDESQTFTKRIIGIAGDRVSIKNGRIYLNGNKIPSQPVKILENVIIHNEHLNDISYSVQYSKYQVLSGTMKEITVPHGHLFVMGDNRDNSSDSRVWGFVPLQNVIGKLVIRWLSIDPVTWHIKPGRIGIL